MSDVISGNTTNTTVTGQSAAGASDASKQAVTGDLTAAMESIGSAIGELKDFLPSAMEKAVNSAISSDSTNNSLYDAIASATYDSIGALVSEGKIGPDGNGTGGDTDDNGRGFTRDDLLSIAAVDKTEQLLMDMADTIGRSVESAISGRTEDELASGTGTTEIDTDEVKGGVTDEIGERADNGSDTVADDNENAGGIHDAVNNGALPERVEIEQGTTDTPSRPPMPNEPPPEGQKYVYDKGTGEYVTKNEKWQGDQIDSSERPNDGAGVTGGKVVRDNENNVSGADASRKKMMDDISMNFISKTAPEFMEKGNEVFDKILDDDLTVHLDQDIGASVGASVGSAMKGLPLGSLLKGGGMAALGAATIASLGMIAAAGKGLWDWHKASSEANKNIDDTVKNATDANERMKNGVNDDLRNANITSDKADADLEKERSNNPISAALGSVGIKSDAVMDKEMAAAEANAERQIEARRYREMLDRAEAYGIKRSDTEGIKKWLEEQKRLATEAGVNVDDKGAFIRFQNAELKKYQESRNNAVSEGTQPTGQGAGVQQPSTPASNTGNPVPLAAGSTTNTATSTVNAGTGAMTEDIITAEERMQQYRLSTFEGIRDALLLPEVQAMFSNTARTAGASVEQSLMG